MRAAVKKDWDELEGRYARQIKAILGNQFFVKDMKADLKEGKDFLILRAEPISVAVRLRRNKYLIRYGEEFTIRWSRPSGVLTEIDKIRSGDVSHMLYGFEKAEKNGIEKYAIFDMDIFRWMDLEGLRPVEIRPNNPPDSELAAYKKTQFPPPFIIKQFPPISDEELYRHNGRKL